MVTATTILQTPKTLSASTAVAAQNMHQAHAPVARFHLGETGPTSSQDEDAVVIARINRIAGQGTIQSAFTVDVVRNMHQALVREVLFNELQNTVEPAKQMNSFVEVAGEKYKCRNCEKIFTWHDINKTWKCPNCENLISVLITLKKKKFEANRIRADELKEGNLFVLGDYLHDVLDIAATGKNNLRLALKEYGVISKEMNDIVTVVVGSGVYW